MPTLSRCGRRSGIPARGYGGSPSGYYRRGICETSVESPSEQPGPQSTANAAELRDEIRTGLAALALPPKPQDSLLGRPFGAENGGDKKARNHIRQLQTLGFTVTLTQAA